MDALTSTWPLFGLRLTTGEVELRLPTDPDLATLADVAAEGIHPAGEMPFGVPWTRAEPEQFRRRFLQHHWAMRASTGSWRGQRQQGQGMGTAMRTAVLALAFDGLGAEYAETAAWEDNLASQGVTRKLGYRPNGDEQLDREGVRTRHLRFTLTEDGWRARPRPEVRITGLDACRELFGA